MSTFHTETSTHANTLGCGFVSASRLAELLYCGAVHKHADGRLIQGRHCYGIQGAVRILRCTGQGDRLGLVGAIELRAKLAAAGATWKGARMSLAGTDYEVEIGVLARASSEALASSWPNSAPRREPLAGARAIRVDLLGTSLGKRREPYESEKIV